MLPLNNSITIKYTMKHEDIFQEFIIDRNLSKSSIKSYKSALDDYKNFNNMTLQELIDEADKEEEEKLRNKRKKLTKRLKNYRAYKIENKTSVNTIKSYFIKIKTFYRHFEIEIPYIPPVQLKTDNIVMYDDIPKTEHIKEALESTKNLKHKAIILFMSSSGTARNETTHLTINDFINATKDYNDSNNINEIIPILEKQKDVVPLFKLIRIKTNYPYYTCCSPEATQMIIKYLKTRTNLKNTDKLFDIHKETLGRFFQRINDNLGWGKVNNNVFFHSHALRKFNATVIEDRDFANTIQGRKADSISEAYFKNNPKRIKERYLEYLPKLTINKTIINRIDDEGHKKIKKLEKEKEDLESRVEVMEKILLDREVK
jgi:site-specific recombinase XerD